MKNDKQIKPLDPIDIVDNIDQERTELKTKQKEIDNVVNTLKETFISFSDNETGPRNFRSKPKSASEKIELIRAFVELQKLSIDINKTVINTYEKEHKLKMEYLKYVDSKQSANVKSSNIDPSDITQIVRQMEREKNN